MTRKLYMIRRKSDGQYRTKRGGMYIEVSSGWTPDPHKAKLYSQSGHCRTSLHKWFGNISSEERTKKNREWFDERFEIVEVGIKLWV